MLRKAYRTNQTEPPSHTRLLSHSVQKIASKGGFNHLCCEDDRLEAVLGVLHVLLRAHVQQVGQNLRVLQPEIVKHSN